MSAAEIAERRATACRAFWSDDPLNLHYRREIGRASFSLKEFVLFVVTLPRDEFNSIRGITCDA